MSPAPGDATGSAARRLTTAQSLAAAVRSWRTLSVVLLSFSSGLPLGLVWIALPDWLRKSGVDLRVIGLITLAQAPWTFKVVWAPLMDRWSPPFFGRRRGWIALAQVALLALGLALAGVGDHPDAPWIIGALALSIALAAATQDIAIDAYAVDVLRPEEQGVAVGARIAVYRAAMYVAGGLAITLAGQWSWPAVNAVLALIYVPLLVVTWRAPEAEERVGAPTSLRDAVWHPFLGFLARHRALEILLFVILYKLADNLAGALVRPFLVDKGYSDFDRGFALATVGLIATLAGTFLGGALTTVLGLGRSLWTFGLLQVVSNVGYVFVAQAAVNQPLMYGALGFESFTQGLGTGAFSVLLMRLTQRRFSATQYALFSSLFSIPRLLSGPIAGITADSLGWTTFFWLTMVAGIPGLVLLGRFVPWREREPAFEVREAEARDPLSRAQLAVRGFVAALIGAVVATGFMAVMAGLKGLRAKPPRAFDPLAELGTLLQPATPGGWVILAGVVVFAACAGLFTAAVLAARSGAARDVAPETPSPSAS